ncbi:TonB family protein [Flavihumibacter sp. R14]|nr:TonB family protein [Flavihumibacter soli]
MMNFKNDLNRNEWLELVFAGRNKVYGAYELRQHNDHTTLKALITGAALIIAGVLAPFIYSQFSGKEILANPSPADSVLRIIDVTIPRDLPKQEPAAVKPKLLTEKAPATRYVTPKVAPASDVIEEAPSIKELEGKVIGPETVNSTSDKGFSNSLEVPAVTGNQGSAVETVGDEPVRLEMLEKYPDFPGGQKAFYKYIGRNLRYPMLARETGISGRVIVSFIIEKSGELSNIQVIRGIGGGCDEEAIRVLKNSPAWAPGIQNGQSVRVAYTMPLSFLLSE